MDHGPPKRLILDNKMSHNMFNLSKPRLAFKKFNRTRVSDRRLDFDEHIKYFFKIDLDFSCQLRHPNCISSVCESFKYSQFDKGPLIVKYLRMVFMLLFYFI